MCAECESEGKVEGKERVGGEVDARLGDGMVPMAMVRIHFGFVKLPEGSRLEVQLCLDLEQRLKP